jgi:hypothetical protein
MEYFMDLGERGFCNVGFTDVGDGVFPTSRLTRTGIMLIDREYYRLCKKDRRLIDAFTKMVFLEAEAEYGVID